MKVLWVSTSIIGPAAKILESDYNRTSGTWIATEYEELQNEAEVVFLCGTRKNLGGTYEHQKNENGEAYAIELPAPATGVYPSDAILNLVTSIVEQVKPDIIHIWGTETCIQTAAACVCPDIPKIVFIQGLIGIHSRYLGGYLKISPKYYLSLRLIKQYLLKGLQDRLFKKQAEYEKLILTKVNNAIVDNLFSKAYCSSVSPSVRCYTKQLKANTVFTQEKWEYENCEKNTIFTVYAPNPDKGLHQLLKALSIVKKKHNNILLKIPGKYNFITDETGKITGKSSACQPFENWIYDYIIKNELCDNVCFLGPLSQKEMAENLKKANMFANPSIMEVHALSLREAMTVGVPCISSVCGSVSEYAVNQKNAFLYRYEEYEILAFLIDMLISDKDLSTKIGKNARESMMEAKTTITLNDIYQDICKNKNN